MVVTGGGRGIGRAIVAHFAAGGDRVVAVGRGAESLADSAGRAEVCDVTDEACVAALFERIGPVDVLVNNAGVARSSPLRRSTLADWHAQLDVNATGAFLCTRAVLPGMLDRGGGRIVTVASTAGRVGYRYTAGYTASKHAAVGLMRAVAAEVAGTGVTANAVCPAFVRTDMTTESVRRIADRTGRGEAEAEAALAATSPLGRLLEPEEVAFAVAFLAAPEAGVINGQTLVLDGGGIQT
ncbi:SDR family oxidoreductase [Solihabitans fulvus]|uniref:SDR family oxidoreductase n=1 Tax=Solihabitans fulvus TaxID=1892852 RepID=A0A5B2WU45_9PSEU|nr:SDR family oxidoreductase [Solihabitans fulvus]